MKRGVVNQSSFVCQTVDLKVRNAYNTVAYLLFDVVTQTVNAHEESPHPDLSVRHDCLKSLGLSITEETKVLGVKQQAMNNLVSGKAGISAEMAIRLEKAFGGDAETCLRIQAASDLVHMEKHAGYIKVQRRRDAMQHER